MNKIVLASTLTFTLAILAANVFAATSTASVTVPASCGLAATDVSFGSLGVGSTSSDVTSTVSMPSGNTAVTPTVQGIDWSGTPSGTMVVGQTHWYMSNVTYGSMTALTTSGVSIGSPVGFGSPQTVHFKLAIPAGQTAASYTQTITFTATC